MRPCPPTQNNQHSAYPPALRRIALPIATALLFIGPSQKIDARIPLSRAMVQAAQQQAPEWLFIKVNSSKAEADERADGKSILVKLEVEVTKVERSASHLKAGDRIRIEYAIHEPKRLPDIVGGAGPDMPDAPAVGTECPAYLRQDDAQRSVYLPAARWLSFFDKNTLDR